MTDEARAGFDNLLLLCASHHQVIDADTETWTVEKLRKIKAEVHRAVAGESSPIAPALRVFVSHASQFPSAGPVVEAVGEAVEELGYEFVEMGGFAARNQPSAGACEQLVRSCDVFVGVLGSEYGSLVPGRPELSFTELEFEAAGEAGIPRLMFLHEAGTGAGPVPGPAGDGRQEEFHRRVREGLLTAPFTGAADLGTRVTQSLRELGPLVPRYRAPYWATVNERLRALRVRMPQLLKR
jgi:hypothetical protein